MTAEAAKITESDELVLVSLNVPRVSHAVLSDGPHPVLKILEAGAPRKEIAEAIDGMRSIQTSEETFWPTETAFVCCSCGGVHRFKIRLVLNADNQLMIGVTTTVDEDLGEKIRETYEFPFKRPHVPRGYIGGR